MASGRLPTASPCSPPCDRQPLLKELNAEHRRELDFGRERDNLIDVGRNLAGSRVPVRVPRVAHALTTERVLVMEFCEGHSLKDAAALRRLGIDCETLVLRVCEAWAQQMFRDGVFNADAHAGNLLVQAHPTLGPIPVPLSADCPQR